MSTQTDDWPILDAMLRYGGSFVQALGKAAMRADAENYARLRAAFPDLWKEYKAFVRDDGPPKG